MSLQQMKTKLQGATKGHSMLKKKSDALTVRFRAILKEVLDKKLAAGEESREAMLALAQAKYAFGGELKHTVIENVKEASMTLRTNSDNVAGVRLPSFSKAEEDGAENKEGALALAGLGKGENPRSEDVRRRKHPLDRIPAQPAGPPPPGRRHAPPSGAIGGRDQRHQCHRVSAPLLNAYCPPAPTLLPCL